MTSLRSLFVNSNIAAEAQSKAAAYRTDMDEVISAFNVRSFMKQRTSCPHHSLSQAFTRDKLSQSTPESLGELPRARSRSARTDVAYDR